VNIRYCFCLISPQFFRESVRKMAVPERITFTVVPSGKKRTVDDFH